MKREVLSEPSYKKAFNCKKCPQRGDSEGCPMWWEQIWTDSLDGSQQTVAGCGYVMLPHQILNMVRATSKSAGEVSRMKEEVASNVGKAAVRVLQLYGIEAERLSSNQVEGHNEQHERVVFKEGPLKISDSDSIHGGMDTGSNREGSEGC